VLAQHPSVSPDDAPLSRLTRAATLLAAGVPGAEALRPLGRIQCVDEAFAARAVRGLPPEWVRAVDAAEASALAGVRLRSGGLWLPRACSADPRALRAAWTPRGLRAIEGRRVARLVPTAAGWRALDAHGVAIAEAAVAVLACGAGDVAVACDPGEVARPLATLLGPAGLRTRTGATTVAHAGHGQRPACIVGGDGHAVPIDADTLLLGPAPPSQASDADDASRAWRRWAAQLAAPGATPALHAGPAGPRVSSRDHLPLAGPVPDPRHTRAVRAGRGDATGALAGLWVLTALGGRGLLWSVLCAELIAASLEREPAPLERALARHLAPERFVLRALRRPDTAG
jgi:tRNA 5-methylaminomethyl-2-thiouridine biosynthesis bifunctional protein